MLIQTIARGLTAIAIAVALGAPSAADDTAMPPQLQPDPVVAAMVAGVSAARLRATDERLVGFGTRNLFSETLHDRNRGVYAARDWLAGEFRAIGRTSGGRLSVSLDTYTQPKTEQTPRDVEVSSVIATLRGDDPARGTYLMTSHYDSRNSDGNDATRDAPGADDNGSATSAVLEAARVMASTHFKGTLVFACFDGEEQGLFGSAHFAHVLKSAGVEVDADINNDIIGASIGHDGENAPAEVRLFSEALPAGADPRRVNGVGTENDSPARELARFTLESGATYVPAMTVRLIYRSDRFLRGGDQQSFAAEGFPAVRFVEAHENFDHQHQDVRVENGVQYGDLLQYVDFDYLARVTQINVAALATLALAPAAPVPLLDARKLGYDSTLTWQKVPGATSYAVVWRRSDESTWTRGRNVGDVTSATIPVSKDDWLFGVRAIGPSGDVSVAAFPTPLRK
jgi:hypothetical protein